MDQPYGIISVSEDGGTVELDDGHTYSVQGGDAALVYLWYETQRVQVVEEDAGRFMLTNLDTADRVCVRARRLV